jgi:hypothetical protein
VSGKVSAVIRRSALAAGLLLAGLAASSCSTFDRASSVAEVGGAKLSRADLAALTGADAGSGATARKQITGWLTLGVLGGDVAGITSADDLTARLGKAEIAVAAPFMASAKSQYVKGLDGSPLLCLRAIPLAPANSPDTVLAEMKAGTSFGDAATKYSADATLAQSGGIVPGDTQGSECLAPKTLNADLLTLLTTAKAEVGTPVVVDFQGTKIIFMLRPFEELPEINKDALVGTEIQAAVSKQIAAAKIYVNPQYGKWDASSLTVVGLEQS